MDVMLTYGLRVVPGIAALLLLLTQTTAHLAGYLRVEHEYLPTTGAQFTGQASADPGQGRFHLLAIIVITRQPETLGRKGLQIVHQAQVGIARATVREVASAE